MTNWDDEFTQTPAAVPAPAPQPALQQDFSDFDEGEDFTAADFTPDQPERPEHDHVHLGPPFDLGGIDLLSPPGFVGDVAAWIDSQCRYPRRRLAVASAIASVGNIGGLSHHDERDGVTSNMLVFCVSASACHAKGHPIMMFDGTTKPVEDVMVGDQLMGPDGKPRNVLSLARGRQEMVRIKPIKGEGFTVNLDHIMNLQMTGDTFRVNMTVREWIASSHRVKRMFKLRKSWFDKPEQDYSISPYVMGAMLGDGCLVHKVMITSQDSIIHDVVTREFKEWEGIETRQHQVKGNKSWSTIFSMGRIGKSARPLIEEFQRLGLWGFGAGEKFIPHEYKVGSVGQRLELLAGLMDTDGHQSCGGYEYVSKSQQLANDVVYIARSVGLAATIRPVKKYAQTGNGGQYFRVFISGDCTVIPVKLEYKKARPRKMNKNPLMFGFEYDLLPEDNYYGFSLDGDHLYMDGHFWVHHNTGKEAIQQAMADLHRAVDLQRAVVGMIKSTKEILENLIEHQPSYFIIDEFGIFLQKVKNAQKRGGSAYLEEVNGIIMSAYSKANSYFILGGREKRELRKQYAMQAAKAQDEGEEDNHALKMLKMIDNGLERPFLSIVGYTTPSTFEGVMDGESAEQGFIGRAILVSEKDINPEMREDFRRRDLPSGLKMRLMQLFHGGTFSVDSGDHGRIENYGDRTAVETTPEADEMLKECARWFHRYANERMEDTGAASVAMARRSTELVLKVSFILALASRQRTEEHVRWAFAYVRKELDEKIALVFANDNASTKSLPAMAARVQGMIDPEKGTSTSVMANKLKMKPEDVEQLLKQMETAGLVHSEVSKRKYKGKPVVVWKMREGA